MRVHRTGLRLIASVLSPVLVAGTSSVAIAQPNGLPALPRGTETLWNADSFPVWPFPGDANRDATIDERDLAKVLADAGQTGQVRVPEYFGPLADGNSLGNLWSDFNGDQIVDALDLSIVSEALSTRTTAGLTIRSSDGAIDFTQSQYGLALVWPEEPVDFGSDWDGSLRPSKPLRIVLLTSLGLYDRTTGNYVGSSNGFLDGKFITQDIDCLRDQADRGDGGNASLPSIPRAHSLENDFRVDLLSLPHPWPRELVAWHAEASAFFGVAEWRRRSFNDHFISRLGLTPELDQRLRVYQGVENWLLGEPVEVGGCSGTPCLSALPKVVHMELLPSHIWSGRLNYGTNEIKLSFVRVSPDLEISTCADTWFVLAEYPSIIGSWLCGFVLPDETQFMASSIVSEARSCVIGDALPIWSIYTSDARRRDSTSVNRWVNSLLFASGFTSTPILPLDGWTQFDTVQMQDVDANGATRRTRDGIYAPLENPRLVVPPYSVMDYGSDMFNAMFLDIANEAGIGLRRSTLLYWMTIARAQEPRGEMPNSLFGDRIRQASMELWPHPAMPGTGIYQDDIHNALLARKFLPNGLGGDINAFLPPTVGPSVRGASFRSNHPSYQPGVTFASPNESVGNWYSDQYSIPESRAAYVAYTFWKHSTLGPCDFLDLVADGEEKPLAFFPCDPELLPGEAPQRGATYSRVSGQSTVRLRDREAANLTILAPGRVARWTHMRSLCPLNIYDSATNLDVNAFGFRCVQATPNGFSVEVNRLGETHDPLLVRDRIHYRLTIVDPSVDLDGWNTGPATYDWTFVEVDGATTSANGPVVEYAAIADQPFTMRITRTRLSPGTVPVVATLTLRERGRDLDRAGPQGTGRALVFDAVSPSLSRDFPPTEASVECGQTVVIQARALGLMPRHISWLLNGATLVDGIQIDGSVVSGAATESISITPATSSMAGQYDCAVSNSLGTVVASSSFLSVAGCRCIADLNEDGGIDGADVAEFFTAFEVGGESADLNEDGGIDGGDLATFFAHYEAGC